MIRGRSRVRVLMADDDEDDCLLVSLALQEIGKAFDLQCVPDGVELLDYLHNRGTFADADKFPRPDLILLDLHMPRIDGRKALTEIRKNPGLNDIPILILSTSREEHDIAFTKKVGADSYLAKPDEVSDLAKSLEEFCAAIRKKSDIRFQVIGG